LANYFLHQSDVTFDLKNNRMEIHNNSCEPWRVTLLDTGTDTMTGGRILRAKTFIGNNSFMLTYGDGVASIDLDALLKFHESHGGTLTMTSVQPEGRFGAVDSDSNGLIETFYEKPIGDGAWINGGFFVCRPKVFDYITDGDRSVFERAPFEKLAKDRQLYAYKHRGFWKCMDTLRDKIYLNQLWENNQAEWKTWK
jgi:glucose-1-phosphate cytidylyltransferase